MGPPAGTPFPPLLQLLPPVMGAGWLGKQTQTPTHTDTHPHPSRKRGKQVKLPLSRWLL